MTRDLLARPGHATPAERFARADAAIWSAYGLHPTERFVRLERPAARIRLLDVRPDAHPTAAPSAWTEAPVLLIHGTVGPGGWPSLIASLAPARFLVLDRPGWGGSDPLPVSGSSYRRMAADLVRGALDALGIERVTVIGGSIGNVWALSTAQHHPSRVERVVLLGGGPLVDAVQPPAFIRVLASPLGALIVRLPVSPDRARSILRESGHGPSLESGRIPEAFIDWRVSLSNDTHAMRHERTMVRSLLRGRAWRPGFIFGDDGLRSIDTRVAMVFGTADPTGDVSLWQRFIDLLPNGELHVVPGAGHMAWFDDPAGVAETVDRFLERPEPGVQAGRSRSSGPM